MLPVALACTSAGACVPLQFTLLSYASLFLHSSLSTICTTSPSRPASLRCWPPLLLAQRKRMADDGASLRSENATLRAENAALRASLCSSSSLPAQSCAPVALPAGVPPWGDGCAHGLSSAQLSRYARHVALPAFGARGQGALARARVLVVGAGGLGSPAALYLAAAGVGTLAIADGDAVEESNLHRQAWLGCNKAASAVASCAALNSGCALEALPAVTAASAVATLRRYHLVLDCTDNAASRYLLSDAAVAAGVPLVSGAAVGTEGQVTVLCGNGGGDDARPIAPCYRCLYPTPALPQHCARCADAGVLGPVPGVVGTLQAVEALKVLAGVGQPLRGRLLSYDALSHSPFYAVTLPPSRPGCLCAGALRADPGAVARFDYAAFVSPPSPALAPSQPAPPRITCQQYAAMCQAGDAHVLVDVRPRHLFEAAALDGAVSIPFAKGHPQAPFLAAFREQWPQLGAGTRTVVVCRRGNASVAAAQALLDAGVPLVCDIQGGITAWRRDVDGSFPAQ